MSLRLKLVLALVALSTAATAAIGLFSYRTTEQQLEEQVDRSLDGGDPAPGGTARAATSCGDRRARRTRRSPELPGRDRRGGAAARPRGRHGRLRGHPLPVDDIDVQIAGAERALSITRDVTVGDDRYRMLTAGYGNGMGAVQTARSLEEIERVLAGLRSNILVAAVGRDRRRGGARLVDRPAGDPPTGPPDRGRGGGHRDTQAGRRGAGERHRRDRPAGRRVQPDALGTRPVQAGPAATGPGRRPRAAHAPDQPAHERLHVAALGPAHPGAAGPGPRRPRGRDRGADPTDQRGGGARHGPPGRRGRGAGPTRRAGRAGRRHVRRSGPVGRWASARTTPW